MVFLKQLTPEQISEKEKEFGDILSNPQKIEDTWEELDNYFKTATYSDVEKFWNSYWKWFVELTWIALRIRNKKDFVQMAVQQQITMAFLLGFDVWSEIIRYLILIPADKQELKVLYNDARNSFLNSKAYLGKIGETKIYLKDIIKEVQKNELTNIESLENAKFKAKLRTILISNVKNENDFPFFKVDEGMIKLLNLISFFIAIDADKIEPIIFLFRHPEINIEEEDEIVKLSEIEKASSKIEEQKIDFIAKEEKMEKTPTPLTEKLKQVDVLPKEEPKENKIKEEEVETKIEQTLEQKEENNISTETKEPVSEETQEESKMSLNEIKEMIVSRFADKDGKIENIEGVLTLLHSLADDQKNEKIRELYYFDEEKSDFSWNNDLLT